MVSFALLMILLAAAYPMMWSGMRTHEAMLQKEEALRLGRMYIDQARAGMAGGRYREEWRNTVYEIELVTSFAEEHLRSIEVNVAWRGPGSRQEVLTLGTLQFVPSRHFPPIE